ncbi:alpha/beta fold hydrolase [Gordonia caeni]|uniref:Lipase n=1 Tax=Gordonia caeni TaxID=1007097 RepID=A0ABP7P3Q0_9ACTN
MTTERVQDAVVGLALIAVGLLLVLRPFGSTVLVALGIALALIAAAAGAALQAHRGGGPIAYAGAAALAVTGVVLLVWPGLSIFAIAVVAGVGLIVWGVSRLVSAARGGPAADRVADALLGVAAIALTVAALAWPGVTVFAATFVAGVALLWMGLARLYRALRGRTEGPARTHRAVRLTAAILAVAVAVPLAVLSVGLHRGAGEQPGPFYSADPPAGTSPGTLLRTERFDRGLPAGAQGWRILYTTTRDEGVPALASALVVAPETPQAGPRPVIAWAHGTTGIARDCAPTLLPDPLGAGATPGVPQLLDSGAVLVATDYLGMGTAGPSPYLIGQGEGRSVLDSVRAARQMRELTLAPDTVVWGHSQGGHAALWAGILAPAYAPDARVIGVAALAPASELTALARGLTSMAGGDLLAAYVLKAYSQTYPDVRFDDYVKVQARLPMQAMAARCLADPAVRVSVIEALLIGDGAYATDPTSGPLGRRLTANTPSASLAMPALLAQGDDDQVIDPAAQRTFVQAQCAAGTLLDFRQYPGRDHLSLVAADSPAVADLLTWTRARLASEPATGTCPVPQPAH